MSKNHHLGIWDYKPEFKNDTETFATYVSKILQDLKGKFVQEIFVAWNLEFDEANLDAPAIIQTNEGQIVFAAYKDELSVTTKSIDMTKPIRWSDPTDHEWRRFKKFEGDSFKITGINIVEFHFGSKNKTEWAIGGLEFSGEDQCVSIVNGGDVLSISFKNEIENTHKFPMRGRSS